MILIMHYKKEKSTYNTYCKYGIVITFYTKLLARKTDMMMDGMGITTNVELSILLHLFNYIKKCDFFTSINKFSFMYSLIYSFVH